MSHARTFVILFSCFCSIFTKSSVWFQDELYVTEELELQQVNVVVFRRGDFEKEIYVLCELQSNARNEFYILRVPAQFSSWKNQSTCIFHVKDDTIPEPDETYEVNIIPNAQIDIVSPNRTFIKILPNDDPYGCVGFINQSKHYLLNEPTTLPEGIVFTVKRYGGKIGDVVVHWMLSPIQDFQFDIQPGEGYISFLENEVTKDFRLFILPDEIPELRESYMLRLINATGGACIWSNSSEIEIQIEENDAPIRFRYNELTFSESDKRQVAILRGIDLQENRVGPITGTATVQYKTVEGTAKPGVDYIHKEGVLTFEDSSTLKYIDIEILSDSQPELVETFTVMLTSVSSNVILSQPNVLTISIQKNDDPHGVISFVNGLNVYTIDEDGEGLLKIPLIRNQGTYGNISVFWELRSADGDQDSKTSFHSLFDYVNFLSGDREKEISIKTTQNSIPSEAVAFNLTLRNVTGGATFGMGSNYLPSVRIILLDNDNAYGTISFTNEDANIILSSTPRRFESKIVRSGGVLGEIQVSYKIEYFYALTSKPIADVLIQNAGNAVIQKNQREAVIVAEIRNNAFLKTESHFVITLQNVSLTYQPIVQPSSPTLGLLKAKRIPITQDLANGEIGFFNTPISLKVVEPDFIVLTVMRDGTSNAAKFFWRVISDNIFLDSRDVTPMHGFREFKKGVETVNISLTIIKDGIPEIDEMFAVEIYNVSGQNERLRTDATKAYVTIQRNDNPGGVFEFNTSSEVFVEESSVQNVHIIRHGGSLERQLVKVIIHEGKDDFDVDERIISFSPGVTQQIFTILPVNDDIPELRETFRVQLESVMGSLLGNMTTFDVTIVENDYPYGIVSFSNDASNINQKTVEPYNKDGEVKFQISRSKGRNGNIGVYWNITSANGGSAPADDVYPTAGVVEILDGHNTNVFVINIKQDQIPEEDEEFLLSITNVTGGAELAQPLLARLTISSNDFPVTLSPTYLRIDEGGSETIFINLHKAFAENIVVSIKSEPTQGISIFDYVSINETVTFLPGETRKPVHVYTKDDDLPEMDEMFRILLTSSSGDTILYENYTTNVIINANDDANGVFQFDNLKEQSVQEGDLVKIRIFRSRGLYGAVNATWKLIDLSTRLVSLSEVTKNSGVVYFLESQNVGYIEFTVQKDDIPELNEPFNVVLTNVSGDLSRLGNITSLSYVILSNDHPNGIFMIDESQTTRLYVEDRKMLSGIARYDGNLTVIRQKGSYYPAKVVWEILQDFRLPVKAWDLFLRGNRKDISHVNARLYTGTKGYQMNSSSCVQILSDHQPTTNDLQNGFTYTMWIKFNQKLTTRQTIFKKFSESQSIFEIVIDGSQSTGVTVEAFAFTGSLYSMESATTRVKRIDDNIWHSIIISFSLPRRIDIYVDGLSTLPSYMSSLSAIYASAGPIAIGCNTSWNVTLQDVRIYTETFDVLTVAAFIKPNTAFESVNGEMTFLPGVTQEYVTIETIDNAIPEPNQAYNVVVLDIVDDVAARDRAVVNQDNATLNITILKNDLANGVFSIVPNTCPMNITEATSFSWNVTVLRTEGLFGVVSVRWELKNSTGQLAVDEFLQATGEVFFVENQIRQMIQLYPQDDTIPENEEIFDLTLTSVSVQDDSFPDISLKDATVNISNYHCKVQILESDYPNGVFQLMDNVPSTRPYILALQTPLDVRVLEEQGFLDVYVVRAQGTQGGVTVEWKTEGISAVGGSDYEETIGAVTFKPQQQSARIRITIKNNDMPELTKTFKLILRNPTGGAILGQASTMNIHIRPSDNALGIFGIKENTITVKEGSYANFTVFRTGGTLGNVVVEWKIVNGSNALQDFLNISGEVVMKTRENTVTFSVYVTNDMIPELAETFVFTIQNLTDGDINKTANTAKIIIPSNDNPYGLFEFEQNAYSLKENAAKISINVLRRKGLYEDVRVFFNVTKLGEEHEAKSGEDFSLATNYILFNSGEKEKDILVTIFDDNIPELDEGFGLQLTHAELLKHSEAVLENMIGQLNNVTVIIEANDYAHGVIEFQQRFVNLSEDSAGPVVNVTRKYGRFGKISFEFTVQSKTAMLGSDFQVNTFKVTMNEDQSYITLPIYIINDDIPEFDESFVVTILPASITGGAVAGAELTCECIIMESDYPYGLIGFSDLNAYVTVNEPNFLNPTRLSLNVTREYGLIGATQVSWEAFASNPLDSFNDIFPMKGSLGFLTGENRQSISINILPDDIPEFNETFIIELTSVQLGRSVINKQKSFIYLTILPNDNPYGIIEFDVLSLNVTEGNDKRLIYLPISRSGGFYGDLKVYYRTMEVDVEPYHKADSGSDYTPITNNYIILPNQTSSTLIPIEIRNDTLSELNEVFQVELAQVELINITGSLENQPKIGDRNIVNVTILENDYPYGLLRLNLDDIGYSIGNTFHRVFESDDMNVPLQFSVNRLKGTFNIIAVSWRLATGFTIDPNADIFGGDGATLTFGVNERRKTFTILINRDDLPELDEYFSVELYNPTNGAVVDEIYRTASVVIDANDHAGGFVGFKQGSLSVTAKEGDVITLYLERTYSYFNTVTVKWKINGGNAEQDFVATEGIVVFKENRQLAEIRLQVILDSIPELDEEFTVDLISINTTGLTGNAAAIFNPTSKQAYILLGASNDPHGIVEFAAVQNQPLRVQEDDGEIQLTIVRKQGKIGIIEVSYEIKPFLNGSSATIPDDIQTSSPSVLIPDGGDSTTISLTVINDNIPEIDESFIVVLRSVELKTTSSNSLTMPRIGSINTMTITITANDGAYGELVFDVKSVNLKVSEDIGTFNLTVRRNLGTFGNVYCFYFLNQLTASPTDFSINGKIMNGGPEKLSFKHGQNEANITISITNDDITEDTEQFEIGLTTQNAVGNGGVTVGTPSRTIISILLNDNANGVMEFRFDSRSVILSETNELNSLPNRFEFFVVRNAGWFGKIIVSWQVLNSTRNKLTPLNGLMTFEQYDREESFVLNVVDDDAPELEQHLLVELSIISGGATLGSFSSANITIVSSDYPYGLFTFEQYPTTFTEESSLTRKVTVVRKGGLSGNVMVNFQTRSGTANSISGNNLASNVNYIFNANEFLTSHNMNAYGDDFMLVSTSSQIDLYVWKGTFLHAKSFIIPGIRYISSIQVNNQKILIVLGTPELLSVYEFDREKALNPMQTLAGYGVSDVETFTVHSDYFLVYTVAEDQRGDTIQQLRLYSWTINSFILQPSNVQTYLATNLDIITYQNTTYLLVANKYNRITDSYTTKSFIYKFSTIQKQFILYGEISATNATEMSFILTDDVIYVGVTNEKTCTIFKHRTDISTKFVHYQNLQVDCRSINQIVMEDRDYLVVVVGNKSYVYGHSAQATSFVQIKELPFLGINKIKSLSIKTITNHKEKYFALAEGNNGVYLFDLIYAGEESDYIGRSGVLQFDDSVTRLDLYFTILNDDQPERDESFYVELFNATNGAVVSKESTLKVIILANDNAYGRIEFANSSLHTYIIERENDIAFKLNLLRLFGTFGDLIVYFNATRFDGDNLQNEIYPSFGQVIFKAGETSKEIIMYAQSDVIPELAEVFIVRILDVVTVGISSTSTGATINPLKNSAIITVLPNDNPYGVFSWKSSVQITTELTEINSTVFLVIERSMGAYGDVAVFYETKNSSKVGPMERNARPYIDYIPVSDNVVFFEGEKEKFVFINITHSGLEETSSMLKDGMSDLNEVFQVSITNATLLSHFTMSDAAPPLIDAEKNAVQIIITEIVQSHGVIEFNTSDVLVTNESIGTLSIPVVRQYGTDGIVGVYFQIQYGTADAKDVISAVETLTFRVNETRMFLNLTILDDNEPEMMEDFRVVLIKPAGGAVIGVRNKVDVQIKANDYPYGIFSIAENSRRIVAIEGGTVKIQVERLQGTHSTVGVAWQCDLNARNEITQTSGIELFQQGEKSRYIQFDIIDDDVPEVSQQFLCQLTNVTGEAELSNNTQATIVIEASDKPYGVFHIIRGQTEIFTEEGRSFNISIIRSVGDQGMVSISWMISLQSGEVNDTSTTFSQFYGILQFDTGDKEKYVELKVLNDNTPEESQSYSFILHSPTGGAELDSDSSIITSTIYVAASGNPYGVFSIVGQPSINVNENLDNKHGLVVQRSYGFIGEVFVKYRISSINATPGIDFYPTSGELLFNNGDQIKSLYVYIVDDDIPELLEEFTLSLHSVVLNKTVNFNLIRNNIQMNVPPIIDKRFSTVRFLIEENDNPYGVIGFERAVFHVNEWQQDVYVPVIRKGGLFTSCTVNYTYIQITATQGVDFIIDIKPLIFAENQNISYIYFRLIDDLIPEDKEMFEIHLQSVDGKVVLGNQTKITVAIEASDNPYGLVGFYNVSDVFLQNPTTIQYFNVSVTRVAGRQGVITVDWEVVRTVPSSSHVTEDITPNKGSLNFIDNQGGSINIILRVLPYGGPTEEEETFELRLLNSSGGAGIDDGASIVNIVIGKKGFPSGLFYLSESIQPSNDIAEPDTGAVSVKITVLRKFGRIGNVQVRWAITSITGDTVSDIRYDSSQTLVFNDNQSNGVILINITSDSVPELDEVFSVSLISVSGTAEIDETQKMVQFTIKANDHPHGVFSLPSSGEDLLLDASSLSRSLKIIVSRDEGLIGDAVASIMIEHPQMQLVVIRDVILPNKKATSSIQMEIPDEVFLPTDSRFTVRLVNVLILNETSSQPPLLSTTHLEQFISVPEIAANSLVQLNNLSLFVLANLETRRVSLVLERFGLYGDIVISWSSGYPLSMTDKPLANIGIIEPSSGNVTIPHNQRTLAIQVEVVIPKELTESLHYVLHLDNNLSPKPGNRGYPRLGKDIYSSIDTHGVVRISLSSEKVLVLEGQSAYIVIERTYSTIGTIRVTYSTQMSSGVNPALPDSDYLPIKSSVDFYDGEYRKIIKVQTLDDTSKPQAENMEIFFVELTAAIVLTPSSSPTSPRISPRQKIAEVTIQDNDDPYGIISFADTSLVVDTDESAGSVRLTVQRIGGSYSTASFRALTVGGEESWSSEILNNLPINSPILKAIQNRTSPALAARDYEAINTVYTFPETSNTPSVNQELTVTIRILDDTIAEPIDQLVVLITNATGGASIFEPHSFAVISIAANGLYNGEIGFQSKQSILDEDGDGFVDVTIERVGQATQEIVVSWIADSTKIADLSSQLQSVRGNVVFKPGELVKSIRLMSIHDEAPETESWFIVTLVSVSSGAVIKKSESEMNITVLKSDYPFGKIAFALQSRYLVVEPDTKLVSLIVTRYFGTQERVTVKYQTVSITLNFNTDGVRFNPAIVEKDYEELSGTLTFEENQTEKIISVKVLENSDTTYPYPKVLNVTLSEPTNGVVLDNSFKYSRIILSKASVTYQFLKLKSSILNLPVTDEEIYQTLVSMLSTIRSSQLTHIDQQLIKSTITDITNFKASQTSGKRAIDAQSKSTLLDIYNELMSTRRSDTQGNSYWIKSLESTMYSFLNDLQCPETVAYSKTNFDVTVLRNNRSVLNGFAFSNGNDFFRYPANLFTLDSTNQCSDVHFMNLKNRHWFGGKDVLLNDKVLSSAVQVDLASKKITYRINAPKNRITPNGVLCAIWLHPTTTEESGEWSTQNCQVKSEARTYVECECNHLSEYAVLAGSDNRAGYELYFFISCFITIGACFLALFSHHCCSMEKTFTSNLLMHIFFSIMITNVIFVVSAYLSRDLLDNDTECGILALFLHYFFLTQFSNIFVQSWNLWRILVMNDEHSDRKAIAFFLLGWGVPVVVIAGYVFITHAAWDWTFNMMYADVNGSGDLCFIPHGYAAFCAAVIPALLLLLACGVVFAQAYQVTPQWKYYDDIFRGRYNLKEVRHLLILFSLVTLTWLFAGLHITYGYLWMLIVFAVFNVLVGLYILVVYFILRNQMRSTFQGKYLVEQQSFDRVELPNMEYEAVDSLKRPIKSTDNVNLSEWSDVNMTRLSPHSHLQLRSATPVSQVSRNGYSTPKTIHRYGNNNVSFEDEAEEDMSADFDDLIIALKTGGGYSHSPSMIDEAVMESEGFSNPVEIPPVSSASEQYALRRIKMADTQL